MKYNFMEVGGKLYRIDPMSGRTWYADHNTWVSIKEPVGR